MPYSLSHCIDERFTCPFTLLFAIVIRFYLKIMSLLEQADNLSAKSTVLTENFYKENFAEFLWLSTCV